MTLKAKNAQEKDESELISPFINLPEIGNIASKPYNDLSRNADLSSQRHKSLEPGKLPHNPNMNYDLTNIKPIKNWKYNKFGFDISYLAALQRQNPLARTLRFTLRMEIGDSTGSTTSTNSDE